MISVWSPQKKLLEYHNELNTSPWLSISYRCNKLYNDPDLVICNYILGPFSMEWAFNNPYYTPIFKRKSRLPPERSNDQSSFKILCKHNLFVKQYKNFLRLFRGYRNHILTIPTKDTTNKNRRTQTINTQKGLLFTTCK